MTKKEAFEEINRIQDDYINELIALIDSDEYKDLKTINFTSATGTGKTKMMSKLINRLDNYYFIITTLSKGQLHIQVRNSLLSDCNRKNFTLYGSADYKINSKLEAEDIISKIPEGVRCIWLRDEGHIRTNRFEELLIDVCYKVINFSATNVYSDISCDFTQTMMLRTVNQNNGTPEDAVKKLIEIKEIHKRVSHYNPCAIFRCVNSNSYLYNKIIKLCKKYNLKYIDISDEAFDMSEICMDDNEYDVIINKYKLVEGIDIRRAHVLFMDNQPANNSTTIQAIGRCRRNALLYRKDIDILAPKNRELLKETRECYVYYDVAKMSIPTDSNGELQIAFCDHISCESIKAGTTIEVINGQLLNGLYVIELAGKTGRFHITKDKETGFNRVEEEVEFYNTIVEHFDNNYLYLNGRKIHIRNVDKLPIERVKIVFDRLGGHSLSNAEPYYSFPRRIRKKNIHCDVPRELLALYEEFTQKYTYEYIYSKIKNYCLNELVGNELEVSPEKIEEANRKYIIKSSNVRGLKQFCSFLDRIGEYPLNIDGFKYRLNELCSNSELLLLQQYCINKKEEGGDNYRIENAVERFVSTKCLYIKETKRKENSIAVFFKNQLVESMSIEDCSNAVNEFLQVNSLDENIRDFYRIIQNIGETNSLDIDGRMQLLKKCCNKFELAKIQYLLIEEVKKGASIAAINKHIDEIIESRYKLYVVDNREDYSNVMRVILQREIYLLKNTCGNNPMRVSTNYPFNMVISAEDVENYFKRFDSWFESLEKNNNTLLVDSSTIVKSVLELIERTRINLNNGIIEEVELSYENLYEELSTEEEFLIRNKYIKPIYEIDVAKITKIHSYVPYDKRLNDPESAIIGVDLMRQIKTDTNDMRWIESKSVSSKIGNYNKLNTYLSKIYSEELEQASKQYVRGKNSFDLDKKCNSMIGYCVEYYSKYVVYGVDFLDGYIEKAQEEAKTSDLNDYIVIRACMLKYKEQMIRCFGNGVTKNIQVMLVNMLMQEKYQYFVDLIVKLGNRTAKYVKNALYPNEEPRNNIDPNLSVSHIAGLADYITQDIILDVKVRNNIDENCVRQVLAYHYLSTKRSDLNIKKVIVYDAVSNRAVEIKIGVSRE